MEGIIDPRGCIALRYRMKAQLRIHNGTPTVFFDGKPAFFGCHLVGWMDPKDPNAHQYLARRYAEAGVHIYSVDNLNNFEWCGPRPDNPKHWDFWPVVPRLQGYIDADPEATFLLRMCFETRWVLDNWWNTAYPDEVEVLSDGQKIAPVLRLEDLAIAGERPAAGLHRLPAGRSACTTGSSPSRSARARRGNGSRTWP